MVSTVDHNQQVAFYNLCYVKPPLPYNLSFGVPILCLLIFVCAYLVSY